MRAVLLYASYFHVNEMLCEKQKQIVVTYSMGAVNSLVTSYARERDQGTQEGQQKRSAGTLQSRQFRSDEDDSNFRKQKNNEDLIPEKVKARAMPVGITNQDEIIKTLKAKMRSAEKQKQNIK